MLRTRKLAYLILAAALIVSLSLTVSYMLKAFYYDAQLTGGKKPVQLPRYHLLLVSQERDNPYWNLVREGAVKAAKNAGAALEYEGPEQANQEEHMNLIRMGIASQVDGILTQGLNDEKFTPLINEAVAKHIPVITVDTDAPKSKRSAYVGTNNYEAGYQAGSALIHATKGRAEVGVITGSFSAGNMKLRLQGFKDALLNEPGIRIAAVAESNISRIQAAEAAYQMLKQHPEITAFFGSSALDGPGIAQAVREAAPPHRHITVIGFDTLPETLADIRNGSIDATIGQEPYSMGEQSVGLMMRVLQRKWVPTLVYTPTKVIRKDNLPQAAGNGGVRP